MSKLKYVHPDLVRIWYALVEHCQKREAELGFEPVLLETVRTPGRQAALVQAGASRTMNSRHLLGKNGFCHAIDIGCDVDLGDGTQVRWDWPLYYRLAGVMREVVIGLEIPLVWGGVWDTPMHLLPENMEAAVESYRQRHLARWRAQSKPGDKYPGAFIDGPHFELPRQIYPD